MADDGPMGPTQPTQLPEPNDELSNTEAAAEVIPGLVDGTLDLNLLSCQTN